MPQKPTEEKQQNKHKEQAKKTDVNHAKRLRRHN